MSTFRDTKTGVVVSVDDSKDGRFVNGWEPVKKETAPAPAAKKAAVRPIKK